MNQISGIQNLSRLIPSELSGSKIGSSELGANSLESSSGEFKDLLLDSIDHVNSMQQDADRAMQALVTGEEVDAAEVLSSIQKADMTFRLMMQVRNKMVQAYQEIKDIRI